MKVELYTRESCQMCIKTKRMLVEKNVPFIEYKLEHDIKREDLLKQLPQAKVLPIIVVDGIYIGSKNLNAYIDYYGNEEQYVGTGT